jgi:hypothetical protein
LPKFGGIGCICSSYLFQQALTAAYNLSDCSSILISILPGVYSGQGANTDLLVNFEDKIPVTIRGDQTNASAVVFDGMGQSRIWTVESHTVVIEAITFQNGNASYSVQWSVADGGALYVLRLHASLVTVANCIFNE